MRSGFAGCGSWARLASMSARQSGTISLAVGACPTRDSTTDAATVQKLSPDLTTHSLVAAVGAGAAEGAAGGDGAGGAVVVVVLGGAVVVVVVGNLACTRKEDTPESRSPRRRPGHPPCARCGARASPGY